MWQTVSLVIRLIQLLLIVNLETTILDTILFMSINPLTGVLIQISGEALSSFATFGGEIEM